MASVNLNDLDAVEAALRRYLGAQLGAGVEVVRFRRCSVGFSWLTLAFDLEPATAEGSEFILQIGPPDGLFAPYTVLPQVQALGTLAGSGIPVPRVFWHSDAADVFGAPFFISQRLPGDVLLPWSIRQAPEDSSRALVGEFIRVLASIHAADWSQGPIAAAADGITVQDAALRQIDWWTRRIAAWSRRTYPMLAWAERWLRAHAPVAPRVTIVHGDYRLGNFLKEDRRITGILDWELTHLGDPHEDLAWALLPMFNGGSRDLFGLVPRGEVYAMYAEASGFAVDPASVRYYEVLSLYKSVAIDLGGALRAEEGSFHDLRLAAMGTQIAPILRQLHKTMETAA